MMVKPMERYPGHVADQVLHRRVGRVASAVAVHGPGPDERLEDVRGARPRGTAACCRDAAGRHERLQAPARPRRPVPGTKAMRRPPPDMRVPFWTRPPMCSANRNVVVRALHHGVVALGRSPESGEPLVLERVDAHGRGADVGPGGNRLRREPQGRQGPRDAIEGGAALAGVLERPRDREHGRAAVQRVTGAERPSLGGTPGRSPAPRRPPRQRMSGPSSAAPAPPAARRRFRCSCWCPSRT